jgi:uncharacterized membrane protein YagU involved in acid resistance
MVSTRNQKIDLWLGNICGVRCMSLWSMINAHTTPIFVENSHERPFSIIPKANTYGFLTKKWSPPEIQQCDLWQGNICGVRCRSLWSMINGHITPIFVENSHERPFSVIPKANTNGFLTKKWPPPEIKECDLWKGNICGVRCTSLWSTINGHTAPIFVENSHERPFSIILKANTYGFLTKKRSPPEIQECDLWQGNICGERCTSLWSKVNGHTTPIFVENSHERPFSIIPKANIFGFLPKKWSPPEIQECDLWQGNICGVRCTSLWSMINGHTTPIFVENSHERPFSMTLKANTYGFLTKKWSPP